MPVHMQASDCDASLTLRTQEEKSAGKRQDSKTAPHISKALSWLKNIMTQSKLWSSWSISHTNALAFVLLWCSVKKNIVGKHGLDTDVLVELDRGSWDVGPLMKSDFLKEFWMAYSNYFLKMFKYSSISLNFLEIIFHFLVCLDLSRSYSVYAIPIMIGLILCAIYMQGFCNGLKGTEVI